MYMAPPSVVHYFFLSPTRGPTSSVLYCRSHGNHQTHLNKEENLNKKKTFAIINLIFIPSMSPAVQFHCTHSSVSKLSEFPSMYKCTQQKWV